MSAKRIFLLLIIIVSIMFLFMMGSEQGLKWSTNIAESLTGGKLQVNKPHGRILGKISFETISYKDSTTNIIIDKGSFKFNYWKLLVGRISLEHFKSHNVTINSSQPTSTSARNSKQKSLNNTIESAASQINNQSADKQKASANTTQITQSKLQAKNSSNIASPKNQTNNNESVVETPGDYFKQNPILLNLSITMINNFTIITNHNVLATVSNINGDIYNQSNDFHFDNLNFSKSDYSINTNGKITVNTPIILDINIGIQKLSTKPLLAETKIKGPLNSLVINSELKPPFKGDINITYNQTEKGFNANGEWKNIQIPIAFKKYFSSDDAKFAISGVPDKYNISAQGEIHSTSIPTSLWSLKGTGNKNGFTISDLKSNVLEGVTKFSGNLKWLPSIMWQAKLASKNINPGIAWKKWPGNIMLEMTTTGSESIDPTSKPITNSDATNIIPPEELKYILGSIKITNLSGILQNQRLKGSGQLMIGKNNNFEFTNAQLTLGDSNIIINGGNSNNQWDLDWEISLPQLQSFYGTTSGSFSSKGSLKGALGKAQLSTNIIANKFSTDNFYAQVINGELKWQQSTHAINSNIQLTNGNIDSLDYDNVKFIAATTGQDQKFSIIAKYNKQQLIADLDGTWQNNTWDGKVQRLYWLSPSASLWELKTPSNIILGKDLISLRNFDWQTTNQKITGQMTWSPKNGPKGVFKVDNFNMHDLSNILPNNLDISSNLNLTAKIENKNGKYGAYVIGALSKGEIIYQASNIIKNINFSKSEFTGKYQDNELIIDGSLTLPKNPALIFQLSLPNFKIHNSKNIKSQKINGQITLDFDELDILPSLIPYIKNTEGNIKGKMDFTGSVSQPVLSGTISLSNAKVEIPSLNITLQQLNIKINAQKELGLTINASAKSGNGTLNLSGKSILSESGYPSEFKLTGNNSPVINTKEYNIVASPNLSLDYKNNTASLTGNVILNSANISPKDFTNTVKLPSFVSFTNNKSPFESSESTLPFKTNYSVNITANSNVHFAYGGLDADITGQIHLYQNDKQLAMADGEIDLSKGVYVAYGKSLTISSGKLNYTQGLLDNPGLDISAERIVQTAIDTAASSTVPGEVEPTQLLPQIKNITVGVHVTGTWSNPLIDLYASDTSLSQADMLSLLVLGIPESQLNSTEGDSVAQAASALNFIGTKSNITNQLKHTLGLNEIDISETPTIDPETSQVIQNTSLKLGKKLSKKLLLEYSIGLIDPVSAVQLTYFLNNHWYVTTGANTIENSGDIFYTFER